MPIRSDVRSTDYHRRPCGEYIMRGIDITVMVYLTLRTIPLPNIQRHFFNNMSAVSAALRTWKPSVNFYQFTTVPLALVSKLADKFAPRSIANALSQLTPLLSLWENKNKSQIFNCRYSKHLSVYFLTEWLKSGFLVKVLCSKRS